MNAKALIIATGDNTQITSSKSHFAVELLKKPLINWVIDVVRTTGIVDICVVADKRNEESIKPLVGDCEFVVVKNNTSFKEQLKSVKALSGYEGNLLVIDADSALVTPFILFELISACENDKAACSVLVSDEECECECGCGCVDEECEYDSACGVFCFNAKMLLALDFDEEEKRPTDAVNAFFDEGEKCKAFMCNDDSIDIKIENCSDLAYATHLMQCSINEYWMESGVTMLDPSTVWIGPDVKLQPDTEILPMTMLWGDTKIGKCCIVGPNTRLSNVKAGDDCVLDETIGFDSVIENGVNCGPRCYLRAGSHLLNNSKAGTCVEIKNSTVGEGSKVPHLSYVGDTVIGKECNLGAGTITCNYDGKNKHQTYIGDNAFIGSSSMLVAPVNVGSGACVGALSAITKDVPDDALAIERSEQKHIEGWTKRKHQKK